MANVPVNPTASYTVGAEVIGGIDYQLVKLVGGQAGSTQPIPGDSTLGLGVQVLNVPQVGVSSMPAVSGTVTVATGTVTVAGGSLNVVSTVAAILGSVLISGTVSVSGAAGGGVTTTAPPSISAAGQVMWIAGGQSTTAFPVVVTGTVTAGAGTTVVSIGNVVPVTTAASVSVTGLPVWLNPTQQVVVSGLAGQSVSAVVSGTVSVLNVVPITTAASVSVTGLPVWLNPTQQVVVSGLVGHSITGSVNIVSTVTVTGSVGISNMPAVSISGIVPVTTAASVSVTGLPVWLNPTQSVNIGSIASTVNVAIVAGAGGGGSVTTASPSISATGQVMWLAGGQSTTASPIFVSQINPPAGGGGSVTTAVPSVSATGQIMWIVGGQSTTAFPVVVTGTVTAGAGTTVVSIQNIVAVTTAASVSVSGLPVWLNPTQQVVVSGFAGQSVSAVVSGTVTVNGSVSLSGTGLVSVVPGLSVSAVVSGTISVLNVVPVTTAASVSVTALPVWLNPTQQVVVSGFAGQSVSAVVSGTVTVNGSVSLSGTGLVSVVPGLSVSAVVSGTVTVSGYSVTTAVPSASATGGVMWIVGGQSTTAFPVVVTGTVTAGAGTTVVSIQNIVAVTTAASVSVSGLPVWLNPTQTVAVSGAIAAVTTQSNVTGAPIWLAPTQTMTVTVANALYTSTAVTTGTAQAVWIMNPTTVTVTIAGTTTGTISLLSIVPVTTQTSVSVSGIPIWFNPGALVAISGVVPVTTAASVSVSAVPVWLNPTQTVAMSGMVFTTAHPDVTVTVPVIRNIPYGSVTGTALYQELQVNTTGQLVVTVTGAPAFVPVMIQVSSTAIAQSAAFYAMTIWTGGTVAGAGTTAWPVPAGKQFRLLNIQAVMTTSAAVGGTVQFVVVAATATASMNSASFRTQGFQGLIQGVVTALPVAVGPLFVEADTPAATTIGVAIVASTAAVLQNVIVQGYLF